MPVHTMKLPVRLDVRADGLAITGTDADGKSVHFEDLLAKGDIVATASMVDRDGEQTGDVFGPFGHVVSWAPGELSIVEPRAVCDRLGHNADMGVCPTCSALVGSVDLTRLPYADYGGAARELAEIHKWIRDTLGLVQSEGDGEWGSVSSSTEATEWNEVGSTLDVIKYAERIAAMEGWCQHYGETEDANERLLVIRTALADDVTVLSDPAKVLARIAEVAKGDDYDIVAWARDVIAAADAARAVLGIRVLPPPT